MALTLKNVFSSHIAAVGYDPDSLELHVTYRNGKRAVYNNVPAKTGDIVIKSTSIGTAIHALVRNKYDFQYVKPAPLPQPMPHPPLPDNKPSKDKP